MVPARKVRIGVAAAFAWTTTAMAVSRPSDGWHPEPDVEVAGAIARPPPVAVPIAPARPGVTLASVALARGETVLDAVWSPDGERVAVSLGTTWWALAGPRLVVVDVGGGVQPLVADDGARPIRPDAWVGDTLFVEVHTRAGRREVHTAAPDARLRPDWPAPFTRPTGEVVSVTATPDGAQLAWVEDAVLVYREVDDGEEVWRAPIEPAFGWGLRPRLSPLGRSLLVSEGDREVAVALPLGPGIDLARDGWSAAFGPRDRVVAVGPEGALALGSTLTGLHPLRDFPPVRIGEVSIGDDGRLVAAIATTGDVVVGVDGGPITVHPARSASAVRVSGIAADGDVAWLDEVDGELQLRSARIP